MGRYNSMCNSYSGVVGGLEVSPWGRRVQVSLLGRCRRGWGRGPQLALMSFSQMEVGVRVI